MGEPHSAASSALTFDASACEPQLPGLIALQESMQDAPRAAEQPSQQKSKTLREVQHADEFESQSGRQAQTALDAIDFGLRLLRELSQSGTLDQGHIQERLRPLAVDIDSLLQTLAPIVSLSLGEIP